MENEKLFPTDRNRIPQAWNGIPNSSFYRNSENSIDVFESALSSMVSSPVNSHTGIPVPGVDDGIVLRELIGRLGSICNSSEISPQSCCNNGSNSESNSCYNTPLNSPPKLNLSITDHQIHGSYSVQGNCQFPSRFSAGSQFMRIPEENKNCSEGSMVFETNGRKRKGSFKGKGKETQSGTCTCTAISAKDDKGVAEVEKDESDAKRSKSNEKSTEPVKDYIHVRARRGQATDSHSLAERVRREKISERMKFLQDLVPGCNKVTGKAVMLDEIINYVQSLQRQVEFLSMKLATVDPSMDVSMEALVSKDIFRPRVSVTNNVNPLVQPFSYGLQTQMNCMVPSGLDNQFTMNPMMVAMQCNSIMKPSHIHGFGEVSTFSENDLQSVVKMAIDQDQLQGFLGQMKVEL